MPESPFRFFQGLGPDRIIPFACLGTKCPNNCCGPFNGLDSLQATLTSSDLGIPLLGEEDAKLNTSVSIFAQIRLTAEDVRRLQDEGLDYVILRRGSPNNPAYFLRLAPDGSCVALNSDRMCTIHHGRPTICRAFPFYIDLFAGLSLIKACPGVNGGESAVVHLEEEILAAAKMYQFWISEILGKRGL
jgi:Fe-S-cluster containining protein